MIRVKICGITNGADALAAIDAGANLLGFNFYAKSPRHITVAEAAKIRPQLPKNVKAVGIFVNFPPVEAAALCKSLKLHAAQLHGASVTCRDRKSTRLNSSHQIISYAVFCLKKKNNTISN